MDSMHRPFARSGNEGAKPADSADTSFSIVAIDAYHLVVADRSYWGGFRQESLLEGERFLLKSGWRTVYGRNVESAIIKVTLADGSVGWGEATEPICPEVICRLAADLLGPVLGTRDFNHPAGLWAHGYELQRGRGHGSGYFLHALAALDIAVWDALARRNAIPLSALLCRSPKSSVPIYLSGIRRATLHERTDHLSQLVASGLTAVKIFAGNETHSTLAEVDALRAAVPGAWDLMVDALWSYDQVEDAIDASRQLGERGVRWLECPLVPEELDLHRELAQQAGVPIALGEHFFTHHQSEPWMRARAMQMFQPDIGRTGISDGLRQVAAAGRQGIGSTPHMGSGSPVVQAAALQVWASIAAAAPCEYQFDLADLLPEVFDNGWRYADGALAVPDRPGSGVEVNETALQRLSATVETWRKSGLRR